VAENKALSVEVDRLRSEAGEKTAEMSAQEEHLLDLNRRLADQDRQRMLTPFLGTCLGWQDKVAVRCLQSGLPMRMVADEGEVERD